MSVLYNDVQMDQETARIAEALKLMQSLSRNTHMTKFYSNTAVYGGK